jgi:hypothetical protein
MDSFVSDITALPHRTDQPVIGGGNIRHGHALR